MAQVQEMKQGIKEMIDIPSGISVSVSGNSITVSGKSKETRAIGIRNVSVSVEGQGVIFSSAKDTKRGRKQIGSLKAHLRNMFRGVDKGHVYRLKICSGHFPMNVAVNKNEFTVKNFLGEKVPRTLKLNDNVKVKVEGDQVLIESSSKEIAGQTAAAIETLTKRANYDKRVFQDGIYVIDKDGKGV